MKIHNEKRLLEDKLTVLEEAQRAQPSCMISDTEGSATLNENGKLPRLIDEVREIIDKPGEEITHNDTFVLRLCRYSKQRMHFHLNSVMTIHKSNY